MRLESTIAIRRPPEVVWAFLCDLSNLPKWDRGVARAIETSAPPRVASTPVAKGVGLEFDTEAHASPGNARDNGKMSYRVSTVDPNAQRCTIDLVSTTGNARFFRRAQWIFQVTPTLSGSRVSCAVDFAVRPAYFFMAPLLWLNRRAIALDLASLKRVLESVG